MHPVVGFYFHNLVRLAAEYECAAWAGGGLREALFFIWNGLDDFLAMVVRHIRCPNLAGAVPMRIVSVKPGLFHIVHHLRVPEKKQ